MTKTEVLLICSSSMSFPVSKPTTRSVCGTEISFSSSARNLVFYNTVDISIKLHIKNVCRLAYWLWASPHQFISPSSVCWLYKNTVCAFVLSRLDYYNSLLSSCSEHLFEKVQKARNSAARLIPKARRWDHVSPLLRTLHCLPFYSSTHWV